MEGVASSLWLNFFLKKLQRLLNNITMLWTLYNKYPYYNYSKKNVSNWTTILKPAYCFVLL